MPCNRVYCECGPEAWLPAGDDGWRDGNGNRDGMGMGVGEGEGTWHEHGIMMGSDQEGNERGMGMQTRKGMGAGARCRSIFRAVLTDRVFFLKDTSLTAVGWRTTAPGWPKPQLVGSEQLSFASERCQAGFVFKELIPNLQSYLRSRAAWSPATFS